MDSSSLPSYIVFSPIEQVLASYSFKSFSQISILCDDNTYVHCLPQIRISHPRIDVFKIASGEVHKNINTLSEIWKHWVEIGMDRSSLCINLGGGVIGDMGGFAASCYMRGISFINIPTTLLSQVDASVGGKLGIDFLGYKNLIGNFNLPKNVLIDPCFLQTLPYNELRSGFAEMIKHGLIADKQHFSDLERLDTLEVSSISSYIKRSIEIKSKVCLEDPTEKGLRKILNFGHTVGHAIESFRLHSEQPLLHGEAVALGMLTEAILSFEKGFLTLHSFERIHRLIHRFYGDLRVSRVPWDNIWSFILSDKKNKSGEALFVLLNNIGSAVYDVKVSEKECKAAWDIMKVRILM